MDRRHGVREFLGTQGCNFEAWIARATRGEGLKSLDEVRVCGLRVAAVAFREALLVLAALLLKTRRASLVGSKMLLLVGQGFGFREPKRRILSS